MSIAPPGYPTDETDPGSGNRQADDSVRYEFKSVQALRGRASSAKAKWQAQGWEFVSENRGTLRTELNFRRVKPKTFGAHLLSLVASFGGLQPKTQLALIASCTLILVTGIVGIIVGTQSGADALNPRAAQTTAPTARPAEPTVTGIAVDERLDESDPPTATPTATPTAAPTPSAARAERRAKARAREQRERKDNTARLLSGVTCDELGVTDILVTPGAEIDADNDGVGCES